MPDPSQLNAVLSFLDDPSMTVRGAITAELKSYGNTLEENISSQNIVLSDEQRKLLTEILANTNNSPLFLPGQLVTHMRYGYRGVVVDMDLACEADEEWYQSNQTQPRRDQPWYHVLVHESVHSTYAAQTSLRMDFSGQEIEHPLIPCFFDDFQKGKYIRNTRPWPKES